jgi:hypothetical protein
MVRIFKAGRTIRVEKGVVLYVKHDLSVEAELIETTKNIYIDERLFSCVIFISEEDKQWQHK